MNKKLTLLISVFLVLGLSGSVYSFSGTGYSIISAQSLSACDPNSGPIPSPGCNCGGTDYYSGFCCTGVYSASTACGTSSSPSSCASPASVSCGTGYTTKLVTPSSGCPYYTCEYSASPSPTSSPSPSYSPSSSLPPSCPTNTLTTASCTCNGVTYSGGGYCCGANAGVGSWSNSPCPSPTYTFTCSASTPQHCGTTPACESVGGKWNTATNHCESSTGSSCSSSAPGNCYDKPACEGASNFWCISNLGSSYCIQYSTKTSCPGYTSSPSPSPTTSGSCVSSTPWYCVTEPTCTGVGGYWNRNTGYCEAKPSPTSTISPSPTTSPDWYVCSREQYFNCDTEVKCKGAGINWCTYKDATGKSQSYCNQQACPSNTCSQKDPWFCKSEAECKSVSGYWWPNGQGCADRPPEKCSLSQPWSCFDESGCKGVGANWCKYSWGSQCESYKCPTTTPQPIICPAVYYPPKICQPGEEYVPTFDNSGCSTGGNCVKKDTCPYDWNPVCGTDGRTYQNSCKAKTIGVGISYDGECGYKFKCDDSFVEEHARKCTANGGTPEKYTRSDGCADVYCKGVKPTPLPTITPPPGCKLIENPLIGVSYDCGGKQTECRPLADSERTQIKNKCYANGGKPEYKKDYTNCEYLDCVFDERHKFKFEGCPTDNQIQSIVEKCNRLGLKTSYEIIPGLSGDQCKIARCEQSNDRVCAPLPLSPAGTCPLGSVEKIVIGENGCDVVKCVSEEEDRCKTLPPKEAFSGCQQKGGDLIVKQNEKGCVVFEECVRRGDEAEIEFEEVKDVPQSGELLELALKLEKVSITLKEFGNKIDKIAKYYESTGSVDDAERYKRVKGLLVSAGDELNKIRTEMRDNLETLTKANVEGFKYRLKYISKVILKDIIFLMLGGDKAKETVNAAGVNCGTNFDCFDKAMRSCQQATMEVQVSTDLTIKPEITGLEGDLCVAKVTGGADSMTCKIKDYALGMGNPEVNVMPYCEGTLKAKIQSSSEQPPTEATTSASTTTTGSTTTATSTSTATTTSTTTG